MALLPAGDTGAGTPRSALTFEQRIEAQRAIERVYYAHQIGATAPFEEAVPQSLLENKVRDYLRKSAALEELWDTPVTAEDLHREWLRISRRTRHCVRSTKPWDTTPC